MAATVELDSKTKTTPATSSSHRKHQEFLATLSLYEKLDAIPSYVVTLANVLTAFLTGPLRSKETRHPSLLYHAVLTGFRTMTRKLSVRQIQSSAVSTDDAYRAACKKRGIEPRSEMLEDGTAAHWIGKEGAEKMILNFHGGGYVVPASADLFEYSFQMIDILEKEGKSVACLFLSYDLAPASPYPRQLCQAASLLNHTISTLSYSPSNILLTGDSAGGNLALSLLSHIAHPHPDLSIPRVKLESSLSGAALLCPWIDFEIPSGQDSGSPFENRYQDIIGPVALDTWSEGFLHGDVEAKHKENDRKDWYNSPIKADAKWWEAVKGVVESVFIVAGGNEVLLDSIITTGDTMKKGMGSEVVKVFVAAGEFHEQASIDLGFGVKLGDEKEGGMSRNFRGWVGSKL